MLKIPKKTQDEQLQSISKGLHVLALFLVVVLGLRYIAQGLVAPLLLALFLTALMSPIFNFFRRKGFSGVISLILMIISLTISLLGLVIFLTWSFSVLSGYLGEYVTDFRQSLAEIGLVFGLNSDSINQLTGWISPELIVSFLNTLLGSLSSLMLYLFIVPVLAVLILLQADSVPQAEKKQLLKENSFLRKIGRFTSSVTIYVIGRFKVNLATGLALTIALLFLGIPFSFLWGVLTVILSFIPYIGLLLAGTPPTLIGFSQGGLFGGLVVIGAILAINLVTENILEPFIQGRSNRVSAASLVIAFVFWTWLLGPVGALLSAPLTVLLKVILADYSETAWIASLMEGNYKKSQVEVKKAKAFSDYLNQLNFFKNK